MKKLLLLFVVLCTTIPSFAVTYNLNGGKYNPYDWASKDDMLKAFITDGRGSTENLLTIAEYRAMADLSIEGKDGLHYYKGPDAGGNTVTCNGLVTILTEKVVPPAFEDTKKWGWLITYVNSTHTAQKFADLGTNYAVSGWKYEVGAFFISGQSTSWPKGASFAEAGKDENYFSAWGYNYGNPETVSVETTLLNPYMEGAEFQGWYDNAEFTGEKITTINASSTGTLYAKWSIVSDVTYELNGGVWNPDLWASKDDMLAAFLADGDYNKTPKKISDYQAMVINGTAGADGLHSFYNTTVDGVTTKIDVPDALCVILNDDVVSNTFTNEKWSWLYQYVYDNEKTMTLSLTETSSSWKYAIGAFFISGQSTSYPKGASFAEAGKDENYFSAWGYSYGNPQSPINGFAPYKPFKWDNIFNGWYDNAEFSGEPVTSIPLGFNGTLYARWTRLSDVESPVVEQETLVNIYNISGTCVLQGVDPAEVNNLAPGFYIVGNKKVLVK